MQLPGAKLVQHFVVGVARAFLGARLVMPQPAAGGASVVGVFSFLACWTRRPFWAEVCPDVRQFSVPWRICVRTVRDFAGVLQALQLAASLNGKNAPRGHEGSLVEHSGSWIFYEPGGGLQLRDQPQTRLHHGIGRLEIPRGLGVAPRNGVMLAGR